MPKSKQDKKAKSIKGNRQFICKATFGQISIWIKCVVFIFPDR